MGKNKKNKKQAKVVPSISGSNAPSGPTRLRFSPTAWAKLLYLRDLGETEVGGFGVSLKDDLFYVEDIILPKQECSYASVEFDDESVADIMNDMLDAEYEPRQFMRIWIHTHPANSADPSITDEDTFKKAFGQCDWSIMMILAKQGETYCRLRINTGTVVAEFPIPVVVDYGSYDFPASDSHSWFEEYNANVKISKWQHYSYNKKGKGKRFYKRLFDDCDGFSDYSFNKPASYWSKERGRTVWREEDENDATVIWDDEENLGADFDLDPDTVEILKEDGLVEDVLDILTPNQCSLIEQMDPDDRKYYLDSLKRKYKIGD